MRVTMEGDSQLYIYLKNAKKHQITHNTLSDILCYMLFDSANNLMGIRICNKNSLTGEMVELPVVGEVDYPLYDATIAASEREIVILFHSSIAIHEEVEDQCLIDLCDAGIFGIEPRQTTKVRGIEIVKPFLTQGE